jgi:hypothetical protein
MPLIVAVLFAFASVFLCGSARASDPFLAAADFSDLAFFESLGVTYKDGGQVQDGLAILKRHGLNCVRLRLFTSSAAQAAADPYNYTNGQVSYMAALAQIVKSVTNQLGAGVFYWGAEYQAADGLNEAGFNTASFFDSGGNVLPVADAVGGLGAPLYLSASRLGPNLLLQWPFSGAATRLMTSTNLASTAVWSPATNSVTNTGPMFTVTLPRTNSTFFRLQSN